MNWDRTRRVDHMTSREPLNLGRSLTKTRRLPLNCHWYARTQQTETSRPDVLKNPDLPQQLLPVAQSTLIGIMEYISIIPSGALCISAKRF